METSVELSERENEKNGKVVSLKSGPVNCELDLPLCSLRDLSKVSNSF